MINPGIEDQKNDIHMLDERISLGCCSMKKHTYYTILLVVITMFLYADQNIIAPNLTPIAREFGWVNYYPNGSVIMEYDENLDQMVEQVDAVKRDTFLGGYITLSFFVIGGFVSVIVGYFTDTVNRRNTFAAVVVLGETSCLLTYFTVDFLGLIIARAFTGIAIGGAIPLMFSLFGDMFSVENRGKAIAAAGAAMGLGSGLGQVIAGPIAGADGANWRLPFIIVSAPTYFLIALLLYTVEEPPRGTKEEAFKGKEHGMVEAYDEKITWVKFKNLIRTPTVFLVFLQGIPASLPWGVMLGFFQDFLIEEKNTPRSESGSVVFVFGLGAMIGAIIGGYLSDCFVNKKWVVPLIMGSTTSVGAIPIWIMINIPPQEIFFYIAVSFPSGVIIGVTGAAVKVVLVNATLPETRGSAFSIFNLFDDLGKGLGVFVVSLLIGTESSRTMGLNYAIGGWIVGALVHFAMMFTISRDYEKIQDKLRALDGEVSSEI